MKMTFKYTDRQKTLIKLLASQSTHCGARGGSRSGKTFAIISAIITRALKAPNSRHAVLRFRFNAVKNSIVLGTFPEVMAAKFPGIEYNLDKSSWFAKFPNGSEVWFGGLDDKERAEKILGMEFATIFLNECSQIPWSSRNLALTRLAQNVMADHRDGPRMLPLKMYYDYNPPNKAHWTYKLFEMLVSPDSGDALSLPENYSMIKVNPRDNLDNLPAEYIQILEDMPARNRKRFLDGDYAETTDQALWTVESLEKCRETEEQALTRIVIAVDPSGADDDPEKNNDAIGIVVAGMTEEGHASILADFTIKASPARWGKVVGDQFDNYAADLVVGELNYGGAMVEAVIQTARPGTPYKGVTASRGKHLRAEPIAALFETGKVKLAGNFPDLEDEMCAMSTAGYTGVRSPNRLDAMVMAVTELFPSLTKVKKEPAKRKHIPRSRSRGSAWMGA